MFDDKRLTRRDFLRLTAITTGGLLAAACQPPAAAPPAAEEKAKPEEKPPVEEKIELTWLVRSHPVENPWEENVVIPAFQERYPNVTIKLVTTPDPQWTAKVMSMYAGGTPPDVHNGVRGTFIQLYAQEKVLELTPLIEADGFDLEPFGPLAKDPDMCRGGKQWALPILTTFGCPIFYNMDLFDEAGLEYPPTDWQDKSWNWDKVLELALKLTKNYGTAEAVYGINGGNQFHQWAYAWGGDCWTKEWYERGIAERAFVASQETVDGLTFRYKLIYEYKVMPTPSDAQAIAQLGNPFKTGRVAMSWEGGWGYWNYFDITAFRWAVAPSPWGVSNKCVNWTDPVLAAKESKHPDMAWNLIKYLTSQEGQSEYVKVTHTPPTRVDALDPWLDFLTPLAGLDRDQLKQVALGYRENYQDNWAHYVINAREFQIIQRQEGDVMWGGEKTPAEHLPVVEEKMNKAAQKAYEEFKNTRLMTDTLCQPITT
ncbi:MAG: extracellular solute-binding protein [Chloroflexi bacterium]|nr:extracellular solute-binding protein [Chloroflexota bacterium]